MPKFTVVLIRKNIEAQSHADAFAIMEADLTEKAPPTFTDGVSDLRYQIYPQVSSASNVDFCDHSCKTWRGFLTINE